MVPVMVQEATADDGSARALLTRYARGREFLDTLYQPARQFRVPQASTIVCRCEEVTAQQVYFPRENGYHGRGLVMVLRRT